MKSKLTLRLDEDLKERAKQMAAERGTSVSQLVEDYFRLLSGESSPQRKEKGIGAFAPQKLPPRTQALKERLGQPAPAVKLDEDTEAWIDAVAAKHA